MQMASAWQCRRAAQARTISMGMEREVKMDSKREILQALADQA